jgi:hypothetical protein
MFTSHHHDQEKSDKKKKRIKKITNLTKSHGLEILFHQPSLITDDQDHYLSIEELLELASHDPKMQIGLVTSSRNFLLPKSIVEENKETHLTLVSIPEIKEANGSNMECVANSEFNSWEFTINNKPQLTFVPKSILGLKNLVKWADVNYMRLRAAGYRHSSSEMYSENGEVLVSMLDIKTVTELPAKFPPMNFYSDLQGIHLVGEPYEKNGTTKILCKIGSQVCNYHFQDWLHAKNGGNSEYCLPLNVIMSETSFAGSTATMCHGAGINNKTLSDLVREIKFINVKGEEQTVNDPELIKAAAGNLGLLGIITSLTFELNKMTYANFKTVQKDLLVLSIPPANSLSPKWEDRLSADNLKALSDPIKRQQALDRFVSFCENAYYTQVLWFPLHDQAWMNCWYDNGDKAQSVRYPDPITTDIQRAGSYLAYLADNALGDDTPSLVKKIQTKLFSCIAMSMLPHKEEKVCSLEDAIHFRKGIQNFRTRMVEFEIPIPNLSNGKPDWSIVQNAWWAVIEIVYHDEHLEDFPMRTSLEMRIMGGSEMTMAAQKGNLRTCSIEILTPIAIKEAVWERFVQEVLDKWALLTDENGHFLNIRPHWAKRFQELFINRPLDWLDQLQPIQKQFAEKYIHPDKKNWVSIPMTDYLKNIAYAEQIPVFMNQLRTICEAGGYAIEELFERFSNPFLDDLLSNVDLALTPTIYQQQKAPLFFNKPFTPIKQDVQETIKHQI